MISLAWCRWSLLTLIVLQLAWFGWLQPPQHISMLAAVVIAAGPLLVLLPFAWTLKPRALVVTGLVLLLYFSIGVMEAWANPSVRALALAQVILVLAYFTGLATIRRKKPPAG